MRYILVFLVRNDGVKGLLPKPAYQTILWKCRNLAVIEKVFSRFQIMSPKIIMSSFRSRLGQNHYL